MFIDWDYISNTVIDKKSETTAKLILIYRFAERIEPTVTCPTRTAGRHTKHFALAMRSP